MVEIDESAAMALHKLLGAGFLSGAGISERYSRDWSGDYAGKPAVVLRPANVDEAAASVRICRDAGLSIIPQGGHTGLVGGATPDTDRQVVLSLERMNRIRDIDPVGMTMTVEAGCILQDIKNAAANVGCFFPLSLGAQGSCQIGGNISTNAGGLNVLRYGMMRSSILGLEAVLPDGRVFRDLRRLRKNNTGFDLKQLFVGTEGTLGIVTAATLKLHPYPRRIETVWLACDSVERVMELYAFFQREAGDLLSAFELISSDCLELALELHQNSPLAGEVADHPAHALIEISSTRGPELRDWAEGLVVQAFERGLATTGLMAQSTAQASSFWRIRELMVEAQQKRGLHLRTDVSVPIPAIAAFVAKVKEALTSALPGLLVLSYGHVGDGNVHINALPPPGMSGADFKPWIAVLTERLNAIVDIFEGSISAEHGIGIAKRAAFAARLAEVDRDLMHAIKGLLDPRGILSPRRLLPS